MSAHQFENAFASAQSPLAGRLDRLNLGLAPMRSWS